MKILPTLGSMMSGSLRGLTASHNKGGLYLRGRTVPTNPNTARQQGIRSVVGGLMQDWSQLLTEAQRQAWRDYAEAVEVTDSLGQTMQLSGVNWFVKSQSLPRFADSFGLAVTNALSNDAPVIFDTGVGVYMVDSFDIDNTSPPGTVDMVAQLTGNGSSTGVAFLFIGAPQTAGTRFYKGPYQLAVVTSVGTGSASVNFNVQLDSPTEWVSSIVPVVGWDGLYVPVKIVVQYDDGRRSQVFRQLVEFADAT